MTEPIRSELSSRSRPESSTVHESQTGTTLSEEERETVKRARLMGSGADGNPLMARLVAIIDRDRLSSVATGGEPRLSDVLAWLRGRPGASWVATIQDIETAVAAIGSAVERPEIAKKKRVAAERRALLHPGNPHER